MNTKVKRRRLLIINAVMLKGKTRLGTGDDSMLTAA